MENNNLYNWVFRFNTMDGLWYGTKRENYDKLFSDISDDKVVKSTSINTLVEIINRTDGEKSKINSLIKKKK